MIYLMTQAGQGKTISEDAVMIGQQIYSNEIETVDFPPNGQIYIADGVGGNNAGEIASNYVLKALSGYANSDIEAIREKMVDVNQKLLAASKEDNKLLNMATTLSGVHIKDGVITIIHVGNTRIYAVQGHYLKQLTSDHTVYNWLKSTGRSEEAEECNKNEITSCFGGGNEKLLNKLCIKTINAANTLLLTSDGIHEYVSIDDLEDIMNSNIPNIEKCKAFRDAALSAGSLDDMTAVLICMDE